jgi:uncharacterized Zn finger protein (UPF0148 family)
MGPCMKIKSIKIENIFKHAHFSIEITRPVVIACGANESGKTSLLQSLRMALTGIVESRADLKKSEYGQILTHGAKTGEAVVEVEGHGMAKLALPAGKWSVENPFDHNEAAMQVVLEPAKFARMDANARRVFLMHLMGVTCDPESICGRLAAKGVIQARIDAIKPLLRSGFAAAEKEAEAKARDARAAWKAIAGETYGSQKAEGWTAPKPTVDVSELPALQSQFAEYEESISEAQQRVGAIEADNRRAQEDQRKLDELREKAAMVKRLTDKLAVDEPQLEGYRTQLEKAREKAGERVETHPCPACGVILKVEKAGQIVTGLSEHRSAPYDPEAAGKADGLAGFIATLEPIVDKAKTALKEAKAAQTQAEELEKTLGKVQDTASLKTDIERWKAEKKTVEDGIKAIQDAQRQAEAADAITQKAAGHHADVLAWTQAAAALAPDGIPAELLSEAMEPINKRLVETASRTGWRAVNIGQDMAITVGGLRHEFVSESAQWRADVQIAEAVSHLSGLKLFAVDRLDVLDTPNRNVFLEWLETLVVNGEVETIIVAGTMKAPPEPYEHEQVIWLGLRDQQVIQ